MLEEKLTQKIVPSEINFGRKVGNYLLALALGVAASCGTTGTTYSGVKSNQEPECTFDSDCSFSDEKCSFGRCVTKISKDYDTGKSGTWKCRTEK